MPWAGVWHRGPWTLPANVAELILRFADNQNEELRWRAVQGLSPGRETAKHLTTAQVVPVLIKRLADRSEKVREAAAIVLSQRAESVLAIDPAIVPILVRALDDTVPSVCGHAARLLAFISRRLTSIQRADALAGIDRAADRFASGQEDYSMHFEAMSTSASGFLKTQRGLLLEPPEWDVPALLAEFAFPTKPDRLLSPGECSRRLGAAYAMAPQQTIAAAIKAILDWSDRKVETIRDLSDAAAAHGAAHWLMTLGPAAESALDALDAMAEKNRNSYARDQARSASEFIRRSLLVESVTHGEAISGAEHLSPRSRIASLARVLKEDKPAGPDHVALLPEMIDCLADPDAYVRARSAELLVQFPPTTLGVSDALPSLQKLLTDDAIAEVGITGDYEMEGVLYHWHLERHSPRASAIQALLHFGRVPAGDAMLGAMIAASMTAAVVCGKLVAPHRFRIVQWQSAVAAAGGLSLAEPLIRAVREHCLNQALPGKNADNLALAAKVELSDVIRQLSGRLV